MKVAERVYHRKTTLITLIVAWREPRWYYFPTFHLLWYRAIWPVLVIASQKSLFKIQAVQAVLLWEGSQVGTAID